MRRLSLTLCGAAQVRVDGVALPGAALGAKPFALLAYLAVEPRAHARDALTTLLWGEFPEAQARASLRQALAQLRRVLGDVLLVERDQVRLADAPELDVAPLLREAAAGDAVPDESLALEPDAFLAGVRVVRDGGFEDWVEQTRAVLRRRHATLLARAARDAAARLDWAAAARLAERWRASEPLSAEATRLTMEAHHLAGDAERALAAFAAHRAALQATGAAPSPAVRELGARIARAPHVPAPTPPFGVPAVGAAGDAAVPTTLPLVGRRAEWDALARAWEATRGGSGRVVLVSGELGSGKSRLVGDFARRVAADGGTVLRGRSREPSSGIPFTTAAELLRSALDAPGFAAADGEWLAEVARLVPEVRAKLPGVPVAPRAVAAEEWRLYEGAVQLVATLAAEDPVLVLLDDVQWCDAESARVVRMLVERTDALPVLWCVALCTGQASHDAPGVRLAGALGALPQVASLPLASLDADGVHALVVASGGARADERVRAFAARLHEATGGLPGYALEAMRGLRSAGMLADGPDGWHPAGPLQSDATLAVLLEMPSLAAPVRDRLQRVGDDGRAVLLTLALAGAPCTPALLSAVHGVSRLRAAAIGDALVERGLAREADGAYAPANLLVGGTARRLASAARRAEVERALVAARGDVAMPSSGAPVRGTGEWRMQV